MRSPVRTLMFHNDERRFAASANEIDTKRPDFPIAVLQRGA